MNQKYIIYTQGRQTLNDVSQVHAAIKRFIELRGSGAIVLPDCYRVELLPERPKTNQPKRKNRNI
jgi:hypothetical protein